MSTGILAWYDFTSDKKVLFVGDGSHALIEMLKARQLKVVGCDIDTLNDMAWREEYKEFFDYVVAIQELEKHENPCEALKTLFEVMNGSGKLLLGMNNRLGIRYFCGDRDCYTERNLDGIEGYRRAYSRKEDIFVGRMYSYSELVSMLMEAGFSVQQFFSVWPDLSIPSHLFEQYVIPQEDMATRLIPFYFSPETVYLEENGLYKSMVDNGLWFSMANGYLVECSKDGVLSDVRSVTCSLDRDDADAFVTIIHSNKKVEKRAGYPEGCMRLETLHNNCDDLLAHGISVVPGKLMGQSYWMPYVEAPIGQVYLRNLLENNVESFLHATDKFYDLILQSSEHVSEDKGDGLGVVLKKGYYDMIPLNSFYVHDTFMFFDQEFCMENYPANVLMMRVILSFYGGNAELEKLYSSERLMARYNLLQYRDKWCQMSQNFLNKLLNRGELKAFYTKHRRNLAVINSNRQRMNYSADAYQKLFIDIFHHADSRKLLLFGSGLFAEKFMALYKNDYPVYKIIDNNSARWGGKMDGVEIVSPEILKELGQGEYKVIICIKNYTSVMKQLDKMGVTEYSIYDANREYPRKMKPIVQKASDGGSKPKKYHVGYIAGVFDLFHIGHLNMFKRAKEQCDYLIVGVVSDRQVREGKKVEPFVPFEERLEMVRSCRYVDEANEIPIEYPGTDMAWKLYHFDVQFSGSDYENNPTWLANKKWLEERGSTLVFFPYTEQTSSTKIKALIQKKLL
ncbi:hypothetical protein NZ47_04935 [Anaerovibrio lipolyticus]|uniref:Cytidyltransferase-like domain-containing protein n=2 Tax=Anaerovibrio lipolyticus TaxID=82374 RepID=A0A0B2K0D6_9FIRM|nr:hypothetical protein NZ47_04935 [Anaerovibrio lipolyticus]